jgi:hypothetical protein
VLELRKQALQSGQKLRFSDNTKRDISIVQCLPGIWTAIAQSV